MTPRRTLIVPALMALALAMLMACAEPGPPSPPPAAVAPPPPPIYYVNISGLALRTGPTTNATQISTLEFNDQVQLLGTDDGWGRVLDIRRNISGWAALRYLQPSPAYRPRAVPRREKPAPRQPAPTPAEPESPEPSKTPIPRVM